MGPKMGPILGHFGDRRLKAFFTRHCFFKHFLFYMFCNFYLLIFAMFLYLEALLGGLWTQKRVKTVGFLRFLKRLFEAPDGPLGLILAHSGKKLPPKLGPKRVPKLALTCVLQLT